MEVGEKKGEGKKNLKQKKKKKKKGFTTVPGQPLQFLDLAGGALGETRACSDSLGKLPLCARLLAIVCEHLRHICKPFLR
jgi:hypothetical protein